MSWTAGDSNQRSKPMHRDFDGQRIRPMNNESHSSNFQLTTHQHSMRLPSMQPNFTMNQMQNQQTMLNNAPEIMSTFHKERLQDVLQHGLGSYVFVENFGLVPKLNHF